MVQLFCHRTPLRRATLFVVWLCGIASGRPLLATDYFLSLGGGYNRTGNQASLEANVLFFQQVLADKHREPRQHWIYFSDGGDPADDLQVQAEKPDRNIAPATDLIASLHRRRGEIHVEYRNHRVPEIAGPLDPGLIRDGYESLLKALKKGDRLIVYVTAHGSAGPKVDPFNTTIDCWNERRITAREFTGWLEKVPDDVPVVMVMAQCYCGGFANTIFQKLDKKMGLAPQLRAGFFAQQHDLPAAGCRPDIEHDGEFSNYFWGALAGKSRNGVPIEGCDIDGNGIVSFAEAYAYAVTAGETIDIPLRTSEVVLRTYSRLTPAAAEVPAGASKSSPAANDEKENDAESEKEPALVAMSGTLQSAVDRTGPVSARIVTKLCERLGFKLEDDVQSVMNASDDHRRAGPQQGRRGAGGRRRGSGRRDLLREVGEKWPELADERHWEESPLLKPENQERLLAELKALPSWPAFSERLKQMETTKDASEQHELRAVKFRRLISALETIVLEQNLPACAPPEVVARYRQIVALEESTLSGSGSRD